MKLREARTGNEYGVVMECFEADQVATTVIRFDGFLFSFL